MLKEKLDGLRLSLIDEQNIEDLGFSGDTVISTIGSKGGAVCAPVLEFEVTGTDSLVIDKGNFNIQWSQIEISKNTVSVHRNGKAAVYKIVSKLSPIGTKRKLP
ncbi:hypothetical protein [Zooshikella harenae]|uniref:Uncharacterized protein n=1 Tax=Zooshikella harenae TaxID=2827238 RepID=A0ABS5ZJU1_9GAMM|nr:hypothetical protein [Zooshikella harenae]MBU2714351.1 hypothetical protein [Zooshikella harenae]